MIAVSVSKRRVMFIDSSGTQGMSTRAADWPARGQLSPPPRPATPAGTRASG